MLLIIHRCKSLRLHCFDMKVCCSFLLLLISVYGVNDTLTVLKQLQMRLREQKGTYFPVERYILTWEYVEEEKQHSSNNSEFPKCHLCSS